jgi:hypothetical protein
VPLDCREPELDFDQVCLAFEHELSKLHKISAHSDTKQLGQLFAESRQPALTQWLVAEFLDPELATREKSRFPIHNQLILCMLMKVMIDELDRALCG